MTREQIIEILKLSFAGYVDGYFELVADQILALPLDVPSDEEINKVSIDYCTQPCFPEGEPELDPEAYRQFRDGLIWMRDEILKRNNKESI